MFFLGIVPKPTDPPRKMCSNVQNVQFEQGGSEYRTYTAFEILLLANFEFFALLRVPSQASWGACDVAASLTRIFQVLVHCLLVDLQISLLCCFVVTLGTFESYSLVFIVFVRF